MSGWIADGSLFLLLLAFTVLEAVGLGLYRAITGRGIPVADLVFHLAAGAFLTLACVLALTGGAAWLILACFAASGAMHVVDLGRRWRK
jgi:hypothetical protein